MATYIDMFEPEDELNFDDPDDIMTPTEDDWCNVCGGTGWVIDSLCPLCCGDGIDEGE